jgi:N-acetylglucosamine malate deacetylase 2
MAQEIDLRPGGRVELPAWSRVLAVVAHPDDESFGLGAVLSAFVADGARASVLCFTHGEASTLHGVDGDLADIRARELANAAEALGIDDVRLLAYPDGALAEESMAELAAEVARTARASGAEGLLVFDENGVTGHPDHIRATHAAVAAAEELGVPVLAWTLDTAIAEDLRREYGADFRGRPAGAIDIRLSVERSRQRLAVQCHPSQAVPGSVLWRRLELQADRESLRWLTRGGPSR